MRSMAMESWRVRESSATLGIERLLPPLPDWHHTTQERQSSPVKIPVGFVGKLYKTRRYDELGWVEFPFLR